MPALLLITLLILSQADRGQSLRRRKLGNADVLKRKPFKLTKFLTNMWNYHNQIRNLHGQQPLQLDERLSQNAEEWAQWIVSASPGSSLRNKSASMRFARWASDDYSESSYFLQYGEEQPEPPEEHTAKLTFFNTADPSNLGWYAEVTNRSIPYDFNRPSYAKANHFTQIVWKDTLFVGCGKYYGFNPTFDKNILAVVCHYLPPGNVAPWETLRRWVKPPTPGVHLDDYIPRTVSDWDLYLMTKPKHPIVRFQMQILEFLKSMHFKRKPCWYDFLLA